MKTVCYYLYVLLLSWTCLVWSIEQADAAWPSLSSDRIHLLGIFSDTSNTSESSTYVSQALAMFKAAILLSHEFNQTIDGKSFAWQIAYTGGDVLEALRSTCLAVSNANIVGIVGPGLSREARMISMFAQRIGVPVVSYAATDPDLSDRHTYPSFFRTIPSDRVAALSIATLFIRFNWTSCVLLYQDDQFGLGGVKAISQAFETHQLTIRQTITYDIAARSIRCDLRNTLMNSPTRIVVVWASNSHTNTILRLALDQDVLGPHFMWISSTSASLTDFNVEMYPKLIGLLTIEPMVGSNIGTPVNMTLLAAAYRIWQQHDSSTFPGSDKVAEYALFAFDATWTLIQSLMKLCSTETNMSAVCLPMSVSAPLCFDHRFIRSDALLRTITNIAFRGVSGPIEFTADFTDRRTGSYFSLKNVQLSLNHTIDYVPMLFWSDDNDNHWQPIQRAPVIVWPGSALTSPAERAVLARVHLRIYITLSFPFVFYRNITDQSGRKTTKIVGYMLDLIESLRAKIGFIPELIIAPFNMTFPQIIEEVNNGKYDMAVGDISITAARRDLAAFSSSIFDNSLRLVIRNKATAIEVDLFSYLAAFTGGLWILLLIAVIVASLLICLFEREQNESLRERNLTGAVAMSIWYTIGNVMGYGADFQTTTAAGRILTIGLYIISLTTVATYTAKLASDLTIMRTKYVISGIDDIKIGKISPSRVGIRLNTASEEYYLREISDGNRNYYPLKSREEQINALLNEKIDVTLMDAAVAEYLTRNIYCNLTLAGADFERGAFGIVMRKNWLYAQEIDVEILSLRESGVLETFEKRWFHTEICPDLSDMNKSIGVEAMAGLFLSFAVISAFSLLMFIYKNRLAVKQLLCRTVRRPPSFAMCHSTKTPDDSSVKVNY
jgi:ABC-type amino acid transport substrate-binding protein/ABC-type branched-subunit amino acid transport system substrate-binding protein